MPAQSTAKTTVATTRQDADDTNRTFLLMAIVVVLGIELGAFYFFKDGSSDFGSFTTQGDSSPESRGASIFVSIPPVLTNVEDDDGLHPVSLSFDIMTHETATADLLTSQMPSIQNAVVAMFGGQPLAYVTTLEGKQRIRREALERIRNVIDTEGGDGTSVEDIYFSSLIIN